MTPQQFVDRWRHVDQKERSASQSHFIDLCALLGVPGPIEADPTGQDYAFERGATKSSGGEGWADVWKRGCFGWEYKGPRKDLGAAYEQLQLYREALDNPPLLIMCDLKTIVVHTNFTSSLKRVESFDLDRLLRPESPDLLRCAWTEPERFKAKETVEAVTMKAAAEVSAALPAAAAVAGFAVPFHSIGMRAAVRLRPAGARWHRGSQLDSRQGRATLREMDESQRRATLLFEVDALVVNARVAYREASAQEERELVAVHALWCAFVDSLGIVNPHETGRTRSTGGR
ncbi:MAG: hypothetical protein IPG72_00890 [Ardenticatenales bacterium]|nr:hypothetical protein [Ardenticatenales bacterium]